MKKSSIFFIIILLLGYFLAPLFVNNAFSFKLSEIFILVLFASSFQFIARTAGMFSLGHAAFYGVGAYASAVLVQKGYSIFFVLLMAGVIAFLLSMIIGYLSLRSTGIYFAMLTLSLAQVVYLVIYRTPALGGQDGIPGILAQPINLFGWELDISRPEKYYYVIFFTVVVSIFILYILTNSSLGHFLRSIRENSVRTSSLGINVKRYQILAFGIAGFFGGVSGALLSPLEGIITPETLSWTQSALPLIIVLIGGINSFWGPIVGAITFEMLYSLTIDSGASNIYLGIILLAIVLLFPDGVIGVGRRFISMLRTSFSKKKGRNMEELKGVGKHGNSAARRSI
ncbi:branched-chain amino acid ABC transporter permease [Neobacillus rhizophilus]|uniref:Branched-chain amino acid ABC transporter permease n=1 Tax=Neobacillus rhizophilus TaxID=2833579 RepID=A0A942U7N8_9BACI|nr:branched-chain amino acid ABC transporter permease [Neobacillus rhizophilus]MBS4214970.1 branched-chain amino acid ABC transporter permease [Neobacillus rhizophilus]